MIFGQNTNEISKEDYQVFFRQTKRIGEGSYGDVYAIQHYKTHKQFAMKKLLPTKQAHMDDANRQIQILKSIRHQNIVQMHHYYVARPRSLFSRQKPVLQEFGIIMERAQCSLQDLIETQIKRGQFLNRHQIWTFALQFLNLFAYLQKQQIAHCDVKPANILIFPSKNQYLKSEQTSENNRLYCKLSDFGLAKFMNRQQDLNKLGGSEHYASPNIKIQLKKKRIMFKTNGYKDDVYSLGVTLYELVTLRKNEEQILLDSNNRQMIEVNQTCRRNLKQTLASVRRQIVQTTGSQMFLQVLELMLQNRQEKRPTISEILEVYQLNQEYKRVLLKHGNQSKLKFIRQEQLYNRKTVKIKPILNLQHTKNNLLKYSFIYQQQDQRSMSPMHHNNLNQNQNNNQSIFKKNCIQQNQSSFQQILAKRTQIVYQGQEISFEKAQSFQRKCGNLKNLFNINQTEAQCSYNSPVKSIMAICSIDQKRLLLGFSDGSLAVLINLNKILMSEAQTYDNLVHLDFKMNKFVSSIQKDQNGHIWIAGDSNFIKIIDKQYFDQNVFYASIKILTQKNQNQKFQKSNKYSRKLFSKIDSRHVRTIQFNQTNSGVSFLSCRNLDNYSVGFYDGFIAVKHQSQMRRYFGHKKPITCIKIVINTELNQHLSVNTIISAGLDGRIVKLDMNNNQRPLQIYPNKRNQTRQSLIQQINLCNAKNGRCKQFRKVHQELNNLGLLSNNFEKNINCPKPERLKPIIGFQINQLSNYIITFVDGKRQQITRNGTLVAKTNFLNQISRPGKVLQQELQLKKSNQQFGDNQDLLLNVHDSLFQDILLMKNLPKGNGLSREDLYLNQKGMIAIQSRVFFDLKSQILGQFKDFSSVPQSEKTLFKKRMDQKTRGWNCMTSLSIKSQDNPLQQIDFLILGSFRGNIAFVQLN